MIPYIVQVTVVLTVCFLFYKLFLQKETFYRLNRWTLLGCLLLSFVLPLLPAPRGWNLADSYLSAAGKKTETPTQSGAQTPTQSAVQTPTQSAVMLASTPSAAAQPLTHSAAVNPSPIETPRRKMVASHLNSHLIATVFQPDESADPSADPSTIRRSSMATIPATAARPQTSAAHTPAPVVKAPALAVKAPAPATSASPASILLLTLRLLTYAYLIGLLVFGVRFVLQIAVLCYRAYTQPVIREGRFRIVRMDTGRGPCTFGNSIFINPALYDAATFRQILVHEKIHVSGGHTLDILLAELAVVFQWFNPFAWLYRREIENNLEFLTDRSVLQQPEIERLTYQLSLLRVSAPHLRFSITNNYNQSLLKRRIVMMNSQHSARYTIWKYAALLPLLTALVCLLNKPATAAGQSATAAGQSVTAPRQPVIAGTAAPAATTVISPTIAAAIRDTGIHPVKAPAANRPAPVISITSEIDASVAPVITTTTGIATGIEGAAASPLAYTTSLTAAPAPLAATATTLSTLDAMVAPVVAVATGDTTGPGYFDMRQGSWFLTVDSNDLDFILRAHQDDNSWQTDFTVQKGEISPFPGQGAVEFKLVRESGTMTFKGTFDGEQGFGKFRFEPNAAYFDAITNMGVDDVVEGRQHSFFVLNVQKNFVSMLQRNGYTPIGQRDVITLSARKIDEPFLKYWKNSGVEGADMPRNLITLKSLHVDPAYVEDLKKAGYTHLTVRQLISLRSQHIDGNFARSMSAGTGSEVTPEELVTFKVTHIDSAWLDSLRKVPGFDHLGVPDIRSLAYAKVSVRYINAWRDAGFPEIPPRTLVSLKYRDVSPELAKTFRTLGYPDIDLNRLSSLQYAGITPEFITAFHKIGYDNIPLNQLYQLKTAGVDADYVAKMKEKGFNSTDLNKYVRLKRDFN